MEHYRVVLIERGAGETAPITRMLEEAGCIVTVTEAVGLATALSAAEPDVAIIDADRLELIAELRASRAGLPVIVITASASLDQAVAALRMNANDFLSEPVPADALVEQVNTLAQAYRASIPASAKKHRVLAIGAHPDDVESGVGAILAAHRAQGHEVTILTLTKGRREGGNAVAWKEGYASATVIGATLQLEDLPATTDSLLPMIKRVVAQVNPTVVYTHSHHDRRQDHRLVYEVTLSATEDVPNVSCYQGTTGTIDFTPTRFVTVDRHLPAKLEMLAHFASEGTRPAYLEPDFILGTARYWSQFGLGSYCEPLEIVRESEKVL